MTRPTKIVVMGVAGSGKTTVGVALAARMGARFLDADTAHPTANVAKMAAGVALTDQDRWPWLARLCQELRNPGDVVVTCSALKRRYRDMLRHANGVRFVFLDLPIDTALQRTAARRDHFMGPAMVAGQFASLERPDADEPDVLTVDGAASLDLVLDAIAHGLAAVDSHHVEPLLADGSPTRKMTAAELAAHVETVIRDHIVATGARRVLLVPPDHTRLHSGAGAITAQLFTSLVARGHEVAVLPATGTHVAMTAADAALMFGPAVPYAQLRTHDWRNGLRTLGVISSEEVAIVSEGRFAEPIAVAVDEQLFEGWDLVVSIGQVLPHEVIGMANFTKNLVIGLGGTATIHRSHFVGAVCDMERIMGRADSPVRDLVDAAFDRFLAAEVPVLWMLTVMQDTPHGVVQRGLFVGAGDSMSSGGAAFRAAADLAGSTNIEIVERPLERVACWLDPAEFRTTWLGNKAVYRTRMAIADGGELIVLAPGVVCFGEDAQIDVLIRRHGYCGMPAVLAAVRSDPELAASLGAAAHLVHGSSESRFRIVYCTDPSNGGLSRHDVESVGYEWRPLTEELAVLGVDGTTPSGSRFDRHGRPFNHVANAALGLLATALRAESSPP